MIRTKQLASSIILILILILSCDTTQGREMWKAWIPTDRLGVGLTYTVWRAPY